QYIARHRDRILAATDPLERVPHRIGGLHDLDGEAGRVVLREVRLDLADDLRIVRAVLVEPEHGGVARGAGAGYGQPHPVTDRNVLCLACAPDVTGFNGVL